MDVHTPKDTANETPKDTSHRASVEVDRLVRITRATDARDVALATYDRLLRLLDTLEPHEWSVPTACEGWDVAAMVGHLIGAGRACASPRETLRQQLWGRRHAGGFDGNGLDAANHRQVLDHAGLEPSQRVAALRAVAPAAVRGRLRLPGPLRRLRLPLDHGGSTAPGMPDRFLLGELMDVIYTRDVWLHTIDIADATARPYVPDPELDGRLVQDVVASWAAEHDEPFRLELTGPAGASFRRGRDGGRLHLDAIAFVRILSGRTAADDPAHPIEAEPADTLRLLETRVLF